MEIGSPPETCDLHRASPYPTFSDDPALLSTAIAVGAESAPTQMSAPHQQNGTGGGGGSAGGQKRRPHPHHRQRKPKGPNQAVNGGTPAAPARVAATRAMDLDLSDASTVTTPSMTPRAATPAGASSTFSDVKFSDFAQQGLISQQTANGIASGGYEYCTQVQAQTLPTCLTGQDVYVPEFPFMKLATGTRRD